MAAQATDEERRAVATHLLDNSGTREELAAQVDELWAELNARGAKAEEEPTGAAGRSAGRGNVVVPPSWLWC